MCSAAQEPAWRRLASRLGLARGWIVAALCVLLVGGAVVAPSAGTALVVSEPLTRPDAIVSLASHEWERLPLAVELAREHPAAMVVLTVPETITQFNCHDCEHRAQHLKRSGVTPDRIRLVDLTGHGTHGEARALLAFAQHEGVRSLLVVTSPYHTRRSLATFRNTFEGSGIQVGILPAASTSPARPSRWFFAGYDRAYVAYEWAALVYYAVRYRII